MCRFNYSACTQQIFTSLKLTIETLEKYKICWKLTINIPERRQRYRSGVFVFFFEHLQHLFLVFFIVEFEQVNVCWVILALNIAFSFT